MTQPLWTLVLKVCLFANPSYCEARELPVAVCVGSPPLAVVARWQTDHPAWTVRSSTCGGTPA
jgi:hypothetical protein